MHQEKDLPRLVVYGSLAPGRKHFDQVAHLGGTWEPATVCGRILDRGWRDGAGYPGLVVDPDGPEVPVMLLTSSALVDAWQALDDFEGSEYRRVVVTATLRSEQIVDAFVYEFRQDTLGQ